MKTTALQTRQLSASRRFLIAALTATLLWLGGDALLARAEAGRRSLAATLTVTNTNDAGPGSLRQALGSASPGDTIAFAMSYPATILLTSGELVVDRDLTIVGPGADQLAISGADASRVFSVTAGVAVTMSGLTVRDGSDSDNVGGAGILNSGDLTLARMCIRDNTANNVGGGIYTTAYSHLTITRCEILSNTAHWGGGGVYSPGGGGVNVTSTALISDSTIAYNTAIGSGSGSAEAGGARLGLGEIRLANCTIAYNRVIGSAGDAGGVQVYAVTTSSLVNCTIVGNSVPSSLDGAGGVGGADGYGEGRLLNTLAAGNTCGGQPSDVSRHVVSLGHNFVACPNSDSNFVNGVNGDIVGRRGAPLNPVIGVLGDYGGDTPTMPLLPGSPAIGAGDAAQAPPFDQRGAARSGAPDIGAYESRPFTLALLGGDGQTTLTTHAFAQPASVAVQSGAGDPVDGGRLTLTGPGGVGAGLSILTQPMTVTSGAASAPITANHKAGHYTAVISAAGAADSVTLTLTNTCNAGYVVVSTADSGPGTLRDAVGTVCDGCDITFDLAYPATITLTSGELAIHNNMRIVGPGADQLAVSGNNASRIWRVVTDTRAAISGLMVCDGREDRVVNDNGELSGGGIRNAGDLTLVGVRVRDNWSKSVGGGVYTGAYSRLTITRCEILSNTAHWAGGGICSPGSTGGNITSTVAISDSVIAYNATIGADGAARDAGGAIWGAGGARLGLGDFLLTNCTIAHNRASGSAATAGGVEMLCSGGGLLNCTVVGNSIERALGNSGAGGVGGLYQVGEVWLTNTLVAGNTCGDQPSDVSYHARSGGHNLVGCPNPGASLVNGVNGDLVGSAGAPLDPLIGPLGAYGGDTLTAPLLEGSPALDAADGAPAPAADQRGVARPQGEGYDIGAFEAEMQPLASALTVGPRDLCPGYNLYYTLWLTNTSVMPFHNLVVTAEVPAGTWFLPGQAGGAMSASYEASSAPPRIVWSAPDLPAGQAARAELILHTYTSLADGAIITAAFAHAADWLPLASDVITAVVDSAACGSLPEPTPTATPEATATPTATLWPTIPPIGLALPLILSMK